MNRLFDNDWVGPALVCLVAVIGISALQPTQPGIPGTVTGRGSETVGPPCATWSRRGGT